MYKILYISGRREIGISRSQIWSKSLMELIYNPCCKFRWSPEGPVSQIHSPRILVGAPGIFSDLLRSVKMLKREWVRKAKGRYRTYSIPGKTAALVRESVVDDLPSAELELRFLRLQWRTCPWVERSDDDDFISIQAILQIKINIRILCFLINFW